VSRHNIAAQTLLGPYPSLPVTPGTVLAETVSVPADGMSTAIVDGKTVVLVHNTAVGAETVTFTSVPDVYGRKGDITTFSLAAGAQLPFGPFKLAGWAQSGNVLWIDTSDAGILLAVITLP